MSERKILKAWGAGLARGVVLRLVVGIVVVCVFLSCLALAFLLPIDQDLRVFVLAGGFGLFLLLVTAGILTWGLWGRRQRAEQLDEALVPLGLTGRGYLTIGRQYHGNVRGRQVDVYFNRGPTMDIYVATPLRTRLGIGEKSAIGKAASSLFNRPAIETGDPDLAHLNIHPLDERWARDMLSEPRAKAAILELTSDAGPIEIRQLLFQPDAIQLKLHHVQVADLTPENVQSWVNDLLELARLAESLPAPMHTAEASGLEHRVRTDRSSYTWPIVGITCAVLAIMTLCVTAAAFGLIYLMESGY